MRVHSLGKDHPEYEGPINDRKSIVAVAVLTYKRPELLEQFLNGYANLTIPAATRLILLVIDNDADASARALVERSRAGLGEVHYVVEDRRGIPVARNRALDESLRLGADVLCFIYDDEFPDGQWVAKLLQCRQSTGAQMVGGPVEVALAPIQATRWQRMVNTTLAARMLRKNKRTARRAKQGGRFTVVTNNWLCDLHWQQSCEIRFDEALLMTGGSDTAFFRAARSAGMRPSWCPDAIVYETMTLDRLSLIYQFRRGASQSNNHFRMKRPQVGIARGAATTLVALLRFVLGLLLLFIPIYGRASPVMAVRSMGWALGIWQAVFTDRRSSLYK